MNNQQILAGREEDRTLGQHRNMSFYVFQQ